MVGFVAVLTLVAVYTGLALYARATLRSGK